MRVLVATDLSKAADEALRQASALTGKGDSLAAVHVVPSLPPVRVLFPQYHAQDALDVAQFTARVGDAVRERVARIVERPADIFVEQGTEYAEIVRRAEAWKADVVVVGSSGHTGFARMLGSVAESVVRHAHCRVLVARESTTRGCVLAATDLSDASLPAIVAAVAEAQRRGVALKIAHAVDFLQMEAFYFTALGTPATYDPSSMRDPARDQLARMLRDAGVTTEGKILDGSAAAAIAREAEVVGAELIVVGSHGRTGLKRILLGSVAERIVRAAACSVLVVRMGFE